jgi:hypothetical protein
MRRSARAGGAGHDPHNGGAGWDLAGEPRPPGAGVVGANGPP